MSEAASGSRLIIGLARENRWGEPGTEPVLYHKPVLPFSADFARPENPTGETSTAAFKLPGLPGPVRGAVDFATSFTPGGGLEVFEHVLRGVTKTELEVGTVFQYDFEQDPNASETAFRMVYAYPPVDRAHVYGVKFSQIQMQIGDNTPISARLAGQAGHGTRIGTASADAGNLGTWTGRPWIRGVMADASAGNIHVRITRDVGGGGLRFRVEVTDGVPAFAGPEYDVVYGADGLARWQNLMDQLGADVGIWNVEGNRDPVEILFPGTAADHAGIVAAPTGDTWVFAKPGAWTDPVPTYPSGQRFASAHWFVDFRAQGAATWNQLKADGGGQSTIVVGWPITVGGGNASKYPISMDRDQDSTYSVQVPRKFRDLFFQTGLERHQRFELRLRWEGQQIGAANQWRESVSFEYPAVYIAGAGRPAGAPTAIVETLDLVGEGGPSGEAPLRVTAITSRDFTPFADLP